MKSLLSIILIFAFGNSSWALKLERKISLQWEALPEAKVYDVEIYSLEDGKKKLAKVDRTDEARWSGMLAFGNFSLRIRARDKRKVPGDWSEDQNFAVQLEAVSLEAPASDEQIHSKESDMAPVLFRWKPVGGANRYRLDVESKDGKFKKTQLVVDTHAEVPVPVAAEYLWSVLPLGEKELKGERVSEFKFTLWGAKLPPPTLEKPENEFVRELSWDRPELVEKFNYNVLRFDSDEKKWVKQHEGKSTVNKINFPGNWPGGRYRVQVQSDANFRDKSKIVEMQFNVRKGDRSPAAEEIATLRESIDRTHNWFAIASWLLANYSYSGVNSDQSPGMSSNLQFSNAIGGTGRLGLGYMVPEKPWGFMGIVDYSGIVINNKTTHFGSIEGDAIFRTYPSERYEIRLQVGGFYRDLPVIITNSSSAVESLDGAALGPHLGFEVWRASSAKLGFQFNSHAYLNLLTVHSPNGNSILPDWSYQVGCLGSYRLSSTITGLAGYAFRRDQFSYRANDGSINSAALTGSFLNLFLEWQL